MELALQLNNTKELTCEERIEIDKLIEKTIVVHKKNSGEINRLVVDGVTALTVSESRSNELASQGFFKRLLGGLTGKNQKLSVDVDRNLAKAQYASQQMIQKLAEQNLITFDLVTAVNNKLNTMILEIDEEINEIYNFLVAFFKQTRSDMIQMETRIEKLERNLSLLHWNSTIEYQMFEGVEYGELSDVEKIICVSNDFFKLTKGEWTTADLMLLKSTLSEIGLPIKSKISYKDFIKYVAGRHNITQKLFEGINIDSIPLLEPYEATIVKGLEKSNKLVNEEDYIMDSVINQLELANLTYDKRQIRLSIVDNYLKNKAMVLTNVQLNMFDFVIELIFNLKMVNFTFNEFEDNEFNDKVIDVESNKLASEDDIINCDECPVESKIYLYDNDLFKSDNDGKNKVIVAKNIESYTRYKKTVFYSVAYDHDIYKYDIETGETVLVIDDMPQPTYFMGIRVVSLIATENSLIWAYIGTVYQTDYNGDSRKIISKVNNIKKVLLKDDMLYCLPDLGDKTSLRELYKIDLTSQTRYFILKDYIADFDICNSKIYFVKYKYKDGWYVCECDFDGENIKMLTDKYELGCDSYITCIKCNDNEVVCIESRYKFKDIKHTISIG